MDENILQNEGVDRIIALHISSALESGTVSIQPGPINASADIFKIEVIGKGGHGSEPDRTMTL